MLAQGAKYEKRAISRNTLPVCCFVLIIVLRHHHIPTGLTKSANFFIFRKFQKKSSQCYSQTCPLPTYNYYIQICQAMWWEPIRIKQRDSPSLCNSNTKSSLAFDNLLASISQHHIPWTGCGVFLHFRFVQHV